MTKMMTFFAALALSMAMLGGCANSDWGSGDTGTVLGGVLGGAAGSQVGSGQGKTIATVIGAVAGAALGRRVGQNMGQDDRRRFGNALETNQTGNTTSWSNPDSNERYAVTPTNTYQSNDRPCREFTMDVTVNGQPDTVNGTACRQADGTWKTQ